MTVSQQLIVETYRCPDCEGTLVFDRNAWQCIDCGHIPNHAAD